MSMSILGVLSGCAIATAVIKTARGLMTATADVIRGDLQQAAYTATGALISPVTDTFVGVMRLAGDVVVCGAALTERLRRIDEESAAA